MPDEFDYYIQKAIEELPEEFREKIDNVTIAAEDLPSAEQARKLNLRHGHTLLGLYEGIPKTKRRYYGIGGPMPDKITLFRIPILSSARSRDQAVKLIKDTLYHEIGHYFGMSEEEIRSTKLHKI